MATVTLRPNGDGYESNWTPNTGTEHYVLVDEATNDGDTSYVITTSTSAVNDLYTIETSDLFDNKIINSVKVYFSCKYGNIGSPVLTKPTVYALVRHGSSTTTASTGTETTDSYADGYYTWTYNPVTNLEWDKNDIDDLQIGIRSNAEEDGVDVNLPYVTQVWAVIDYSTRTKPMATLFSATLELAKIVGNVIESTTSAAGSTTTLVDTALPRTPPPDDAFNYGTLWFVSGDLAGKTAIVTDWVSSTKTFTFATQSSAPGASKRYAFVDKDWPRDVLRRAINQAIQSLGALPDLYTLATFVTVADQEAYELPSGVYNVKRVEIATSTSTPYYYIRHHHWVEKDGYIYFDTGFEIPDAGYLIRLTYEPQPAELDDDADTISDYIHPDLLKWEAAVNAYLWKQPNMGEGSAILERRLAYATQMAAMMKQLHKVPKMAKDVHLSPWASPSISDPDNEPNKVYL